MLETGPCVIFENYPGFVFDKCPGFIFEKCPGFMLEKRPYVIFEKCFGKMSKSKSLFLGGFKGLGGMGVCGNHWK